MCYECFVLVILNSNWIFAKSLNYLCGRKTSACLFDFVIGLFMLCYSSLARKFVYKTLTLMYGVHSFSKLCKWQKNPVEAAWRGTCVAQEQLWVLWTRWIKAWLPQPGTVECSPFPIHPEIRLLGTQWHPVLPSWELLPVAFQPSFSPAAS